VALCCQRFSALETEIWQLDEFTSFYALDSGLHQTFLYLGGGVGVCTTTVEACEAMTFSPRNSEVMWVDQPAGVGFSTGIGTHNEQGVANNMFVSLRGKMIFCIQVTGV